MKTRFAPSPTGLIHLGNARTALFNYLFSQGEGKVFLLRIEDTDLERSKETFDSALQNDLRWLGLNWQEGPGKEGGVGPYHQSKRQSIYNDYYHRLEAAGDVYPCFCSQDQLALARKVQRAAGKPPRYPGTCRSLSPEAIKKRISDGEKPTLRFFMPDNEVVVFDDLVRGEQRFNTSDIGDFVIRRADGTSPFLFCSVIDDALMGVTHILRGEDHLTNTPRQLLILKALGFEAPRYGHISLIVGADGSPLSKRHGSRSIQELRESGYLPLAVINYMARLGHYYSTDAYLSLEALAKQFKIESLSKSPAKFNAAQLDYWQKIAIEHLTKEAFLQWINRDGPMPIPHDQQDLFIETIKPNVQFPQDVRFWVDVCFGETLEWNDEQKQALYEAGTPYFDEALLAFEQKGLDIKAVMEQVKSTLGLKGPALFKPMRVALTSSEHGPELAKLAALLGLERIKKRLVAAKLLMGVNL